MPCNHLTCLLHPRGPITSQTHHPSPPLQFFLAPSLTTAPGAPLTERGLSTKTYKSVGPPVASLELRYETCSTLLLRKVSQLVADGIIADCFALAVLHYRDGHCCCWQCT